MTDKIIQRGEMWLIDFGKSDKITSKQLGVRPCIIISNEMNNKYSPTVSVMPLSTNIKKVKLPTHVVLTEKDGTIKPSFAMAEQIQTIDKTDMIRKLATVSDMTMSRIETAIMIQLGLITQQINKKVV